MTQYLDNVLLMEADMIIFQGMSYSQIASALDMPRSTVVYHMCHRLKKLHPRLFHRVRQMQVAKMEVFQKEPQRLIEEET